MDKETIDYVINSLRRATITWEGRTLCLNRGRRKRFIGKMKNGNSKFLWENYCEICDEWFLLKDNCFEVDHIDPVKGFNGDWNEFIPRLFCPQENLQRLCGQCHLRKTVFDNSAMRYERKKKFTEQDYLDAL